MQRLVLLAAGALILAACTPAPPSDDVGGVPIDRAPAVVVRPGNTELVLEPWTASVTGIEAVQVDGVWVFQHSPEGAMDALHSGTAEIANGCLYVDGAVVVWHTDRMDEAAAAIAAVKSGEQPALLVGGGGIGTDEGAAPEDLPAVITDLCPTTVVWFGAP